jgi:hypothetical protein
VPRGSLPATSRDVSSGHASPQGPLRASSTACCTPSPRLKDSRSEGNSKPQPQLPGLSPRNLVCLRALVTAALFLASTLVVCVTRGVPRYRVRSYHTRSCPRSSHYPISQGLTAGQDGKSGACDKADSERMCSTAPARGASGDHLFYWCLDLSLICSGTSKGRICASIISPNDLYASLNHESSRRQVASLSLPAFLGRCRSTLTSYVADDAETSKGAHCIV